MLLVADWATTAALLAVLLAEGVRRLPAGAIVLRRTLQGSWRVVHGPTTRREWRLVSIWAPFFEHLVVHAGTSAAVVATCDEREGERRQLIPSRSTIAAFRIAGATILVVVAFGVPVATASFGVTGLAQSIALAFLSSMTVTIAAAVHLQRIVGSWRSAATSAAPMLSPFGAPRAAELLLQTAVNRLSAPAALQALVPADDFAHWFRAEAYDMLEARSSALDDWPWARLEAIVAAVPDDCDESDRFCPRCAAVFRSHVEECSDCASVTLRTRAVSSRSSDDGAVTPRRGQILAHG